jgi:Tfp pilus assembly protein PilF
MMFFAILGESMPESPATPASVSNICCIRHFRSAAYHLIIISIVGALIYSNTLTASFQFDDKLNIVDNPFIRNFNNLWPPSGARWFGLLTFSLNYLAGGLNPVGYHVVNISIHILTALSVYLFVRLTFRTPYFKNFKGAVISDGGLALACALLFIAHPIQTQAITYIVQRFASLATLLFLLSLNCYILARLSVKNNSSTSTGTTYLHNLKSINLYITAIFFAVLSLKTKENAVTLPVIVVLYDVMFISSLSALLAAIRKQWRIAVSLTVAALAVLVFITNTYGLRALFDTFKATNEISRYDYLITQFRVIVTYLRLLFVPIGQTIDHHYKVYSNVFAPEIMASLALIALLMATAVYLYKTSGDGSPYLRLVSFGIFWFFITLSIESSIIPIIDVMFEHRLYLPGIGVILAVTAACACVLESTALNCRHSREFAATILVLTVIALSTATYARNKVWKNELTLWSDAIAKKPDNPRGYNMVGIYYQTNFRIYDAIGYFRKALEVDSSYAEARSNLGNGYVQTGRIDEGLNELMITAKTNRFDEIDTGVLYYNIGKAFHLKGLPDLAIENLNRALHTIPNEPAVYALLGEVFKQKKLPEQSAENFKKAHQLDPGKY